MISGFLVLALIGTDCIGPLGDLSGRDRVHRMEVPRSIIPYQSRGLRSQVLRERIKLPRKMHAPYAVLYEEADFRVYGLMRLDGTGIEAIEFWGFQNAPIRLARIYLDHVKASVLPGFKKASVIPDFELFASIFSENHPLEKMLIEEKFFYKVSRDRKEAARKKYLASQRVQGKFSAKAIDEKNARPWDAATEMVYADRYHEILEHSNVGGYTSKPVARSLRMGQKFPSLYFSGYLPRGDLAVAEIRGLPLAFLDMSEANQRLGLDIKLNLSFGSPEKFGWQFPLLADRIQFEHRFELGWLDLKNMIIIELEQNKKANTNGPLEGFTYRVYAREQDLPTSAKFYRIDPITGMRMK